MRPALVSSLSVCALLALSVSGHAQQPREPAFPRLFPNPTGRNGMEEIYRAGDLIAGNAALGQAMMADATLTQKRAALREPNVEQALKLIRIGVAKPMQLPAAAVQSSTPGLAVLRNVARLMGIEQYVLWADGKTSQAIDSMAGLLRLGYAIQQGPLIANMVGMATDAIALGIASKRLQQLSEPDCVKLRRLAETWLQMEDPAIAALQNELTLMTQKLEPDPDRQAIAAILSARMQAVIAVLRQPPWGRTMPVVQSGSSPAAVKASALWEQMGPAMNRAMEIWTTEIARVQLFGVHATIRRHLWEYGKVPETLDELKLGRLAIDPFTGNPLRYRALSKDTYELSSEGPYERDEEGNPMGTRKPIVLEQIGR